MAVHQYDPLIAPFKERGEILDYLFGGESRWTASDDQPMRMWKIIVRSDAKVSEIEAAIKKAVEGHNYDITVDREVDLHVSSESDNGLNGADYRIVINIGSERGAEWIKAYTDGVKPHPLQCREVSSGLGYVRQWVQSDISNIEYLEIMLDEARDFGLNVTGRLPAN